LLRAVIVRFPLTLALALAFAVPGFGVRVAAAQGREDLARARALDKEGTRAYADGRYNDAIRYFEEAHRLGGPAFELWNIAKCHLRLDQPEQAADLLEKYLATPSLPPEDRDEATQQLEQLRKRPSTLTVASSPPGADVAVDGRPIEGRTPTTTSVGPGAHTVTVTLASHAPYQREIEARYGRAIILDAALSTGRRAPPANPYVDGDDAATASQEARSFAVRGALGVVLPRFGSVGGSAQLGFHASGTYRVGRAARTGGGPELAVGGLFSVTGDSWRNTIDAPSEAQPCGTLRGSTSATALSLFAIGTAGWQIVPRLRVHALAGVGLAGYAADQVGGDVFIPSCSASPGVRPALLLGAQLDYAITDVLRLTAYPVMFQLQPSFGGTRSQPVDSSGIWLRTTFALGLGVDL